MMIRTLWRRVCDLPVSDTVIDNLHASLLAAHKRKISKRYADLNW